MTDAVREPVGVRVWERRIPIAAAGVMSIPLRFRVVPRTWPQIDLAEPEGTPSDIDAAGYELRIRCDPGSDGRLAVDVLGFGVAMAGRTVTTDEGVLHVPGPGPIELAMLIEEDSAVVSVNGSEAFRLTTRPEVSLDLASPVTSNITGFRVRPRPPARGRMMVGEGMQVIEAVVYGLRPAESPLYRTARAATRAPGRTFYAGGSFVVADGCVTDAKGAPALVPDARTIVSPIRVIEEFEWRDNALGDMTRVVGRSEMWRSVVEPGRFPVFTSAFRSVDAAFELALETFQRNSSPEFCLPGETGLWSAGYFQGPGLGFGSWRRDTSHVALRSGNLVDPEVARASLAHIVDAGFDNGSDGDVLPAVAIWDHYLATGDESLVTQTWDRLVEFVSQLDERFDQERSLVRAPQSTSNDLFDEPEVGGFALSTEIYAVATYDAMARMGSLASVHDPRVAGWSAHASALRESVLSKYWSSGHGYFTSGPVGSRSHDEGFWETSGMEAAVWGFLGPEADRVTPGLLAAARRVAMSDYGLVLFPHRDDSNHFCHSVWYCWQVGFARAAARVGDAQLIRTLVGQQARTAVLNKTFYEVTDARTGESWRWPGQLWHAAGFVSLILFGLLGIRYDLGGLTFTPAVAPEFAGARIRGLRYRAAVLDVEIRGHGNRCVMSVDGRPVERIEADCVGAHSVVLVMTSEGGAASVCEH